MVWGEERAGLILFPSNICKQWVREELIAKEYLCFLPLMNGLEQP